MDRYSVDYLPHQRWRQRRRGCVMMMVHHHVLMRYQRPRKSCIVVPSDCKQKQEAVVRSSSYRALTAGIDRDYYLSFSPSVAGSLREIRNALLAQISISIAGPSKRCYNHDAPQPTPRVRCITLRCLSRHHNVFNGRCVVSAASTVRDTMHCKDQSVTQHSVFYYDDTRTTCCVHGGIVIAYPS